MKIDFVIVFANGHVMRAMANKIAGIFSDYDVMMVQKQSEIISIVRVMPLTQFPQLRKDKK